MPGIRGKNSKVKHGFGAPGYTPRMKAQPTEEASIPLWQPDGSIRYVSDADLVWLIENKKVDLPMPKQKAKADNLPSSE